MNITTGGETQVIVGRGDDYDMMKTIAKVRAKAKSYGNAINYIAVADDENSVYRILVTDLGRLTPST